MSKICPVCGLPEELCICKKEKNKSQSITVRTEVKQYGKIMTVVEGFDKSINLKDLVKKLKTKFACGGSFDKEKRLIELQGNHKSKIKKELSALGFPEESIRIL